MLVQQKSMSQLSNVASSSNVAALSDDAGRLRQELEQANRRLEANLDKIAGLEAQLAEKDAKLKDANSQVKKANGLMPR